MAQEGRDLQNQVQNNPQGASTLELFKLAGMDVEDAYNKMLLPNVKGSEYINTNRSIHQGRHDGDIAKGLQTQMRDAVKIGEAQSLNEMS